jgi:MYXO-CTERM domain-containing protein
VIAIHVIDDNHIQPQPGVSPGDHLVSGLVPPAVLGVAGWAYPRLGGTREGRLALVSGVLGLATASEALYYTREIGASGDDFTGLLTIPAGLTLIGLGAVALWRTRRTQGNHLGVAHEDLKYTTGAGLELGPDCARRSRSRSAVWHP